MKAAFELAAWFISLSVILRLDLDIKATLKKYHSSPLGRQTVVVPTGRIKGSKLLQMNIQ